MKKRVIIEKAPSKSATKKVMIEGLPKAQMGMNTGYNWQNQLSGLYGGGNQGSGIYGNPYIQPSFNLMPTPTLPQGTPLGMNQYTPQLQSSMQNAAQATANFAQDPSLMNTMGLVSGLSDSAIKGSKMGLENLAVSRSNARNQRRATQLQRESKQSLYENPTPGNERFDQYGALMFADGGKINDYKTVDNPNVEAEGGEVAQLPNGIAGTISGKSHANGGEPMNLPDKTMIFSKKLKDPETGKSYSQMAQKFKTEKDMENLKSLRYNDNINNATANLNIQLKNYNLNNISDKQELNKLKGLHGTKVQLEAMQSYLPQAEYGKMINNSFLPMAQDGTNNISDLQPFSPDASSSNKERFTKRQKFGYEEPIQMNAMGMDQAITPSYIPATPQKVETSTLYPVSSYKYSSSLPYGGVDIKPVGAQTSQGKFTGETKLNIFNQPTWAQRNLTEWDVAKGQEPGYFESLVKSTPSFQKQLGKLKGGDPVAAMYQQEMYDDYLDKMQSGSPEEKQAAFEGMKNMWKKAGSTNVGLAQGLKTKGIDLDKATYEDFAKLRGSFVEGYGQYRYLEPIKGITPTPTPTFQTPNKPEETKGDTTLPVDPFQRERERQPMGLNFSGLNIPYGPFNYAVEPVPLDVMRPQYVDPRYLDVQPQLNEITRGQRAFMRGMPSSTSVDIANAAQAQANAYAAMQPVFGQKYNYDQQQDLAAQRENVRAKMESDAKNIALRDRFNELITRGKAMRDTQMRTDQQTPLENAMKERAYQQSQDYINRVFRPSYSGQSFGYEGYNPPTPMTEKEFKESPYSSKLSFDEYKKLMNPKAKYGGLTKKIKPKIKK